MIRTGLPCGVLILVAATALAQVPAGPELLVSSPPGLVQAFSRVAMDSQGNFVVVWVDTGPVATITARRYDAAGVPRGGTFVVNANPPYIQQYPRVASVPNGKFVVVWHAGAPGTNFDVQARRYDETGSPLGGRFTVNTYLTGYQLRPDVATDGAGNFVVVWTSYNGVQDAGAGVFAQRFNAAGARIGNEFRVNTYTTGDQTRASVASGAAGNFVVVWLSDDGSSTGVFARRYDAGGTAQGAEFRVNTATPGIQSQPGVTADGPGAFVVAWTTPGTVSTTVAGQRFDAAGAPRGGEFRIPTNTTTQMGAGAVASDASGSFLVAWSSNLQDGSSVGVFGQRFESSGAPKGAEFRVNTYTTSGQGGASVAIDQAANFVVTWDHNPQGGYLEVHAQRFGGLVAAPTVVDAAGNRVFEPGETVIAAPAWTNLNGAPQTFTGTASNLTGPGAPNNPAYAILDAAANYGTVPNGATGSCTATGNCYSFSIGAPTTRPVLHWDATFREDLLPLAQGQSPTRRLHVGDSFGDVPRGSIYYRFVETILHHDLTGGCGGGNFCPVASTPREQMAVFVLVAKEGNSYQPASCIAGSEMFADVPASSPFCRWIEELARRNITGGCGGGNFCPLSPVSREQMTVFALATKEVAGYSPPACVAGSERFADVPASSPFCRWIEELARRGVAGGCGGGNFCPITQVSREQNSVFVTGTFGLALY